MHDSEELVELFVELHVDVRIHVEDPVAASRLCVRIGRFASWSKTWDKTPSSSVPCTKSKGTYSTRTLLLVPWKRAKRSSNSSWGNFSRE